MRYCTLFILVLLSLSGWAQDWFDTAEISRDTRLILKGIENDRVVPADTMGFRLEFLPKDYPLTLLTEKVSVEELKKLTDHNNPIIRCYAFKALTMVSEPDAYSIVIKHLQDSAVISTLHGCILRKELVGDYFVGAYKGHEATKPNQANRETLDSLLIFTPNRLHSRSWVMQSIKPEKKYYHRIREIVITDPVSGALIALAKFHKEHDIDLIMHTCVTDGFYRYLPLMANFMAIKEFHHPSFLPFLQTHLEAKMMTPPRGDTMVLIEAIASYNNKTSRELLSLLFQIKDNELRSQHLKELYWVLKRNSHPLFNDIRQRLDAEKINNHG